MKTNWKYYSVRIIKQITVEQKQHGELTESFEDSQLFEESILLINAQSCNHAKKVAEAKAKRDEISYLNAIGEEVCWKFVKIVSCYEIMNDLKSGTELYSCLHTAHKDITAEDFINEWFNDSGSD